MDLIEEARNLGECAFATRLERPGCALNASLEDTLPGMWVSAHGYGGERRSEATRRHPFSCGSMVDKPPDP